MKREFGNMSNIRKTVLAVLAASSVLITASAAMAQSISVQGNRRTDAETIRSYFTPNSGRYYAQSINQGVKDLYATGMYSDVRVSRTGSGIAVSVVENNSIASVQFKGNSRLKADQLNGEIRSKAGTPFNRAFLEADAQRIRDIYQRVGRLNATVDPQVTEQPNGRTEIVFNIKEGDRVGIKSIEFDGNQAFSDRRLRDQMTTTESNWLSFIKTSDVYDPDRLNSDLELLRRYYLKKGYADFRVTGTDAQLDAERKGYAVKIGVEEGEQYRFGRVDVESRVATVPSDTLRRKLQTSSGSVFNAEAVEQTVEAMSLHVAAQGYPFVQVRPRGEKDAAGRLINVTFVVEEGSRLYVERINVRGNTRSRDYVVRREFDLSEGDAYNRIYIDRAERRLKNLGYFKTVKITQEPGSSADRVVINVDVEDQPTGEFSVAGGYSTSDGMIGEIGVAERNFLGRGQYVKIAGQLGQRTQGVDFSFTEPYFLDRRMAFGVDAYAKQSDLTRYANYENELRGGGLRLGLPFDDYLTLTLRYQAYEQNVTVPATLVPLASVAILDARGKTFTSLAGFTLSYNTLDNRFSPTSGWLAELKQDFAGLGGNSKFVRTSADVRYFHDLGNEFIGIARAQGGHMFGWGGKDLKIMDQFFMGPTLVRGFAPSGLGPRDITTDPAKNALGGTSYAGGSLEVQFPILGLPKEIGMKAAVFADAGTVFGYEGNKAGITLWDEKKIRSSVGAGILWNSPLGPIRFDYAYVLSKGQYDRKQALYFSGGTRF